MLNQQLAYPAATIEPFTDVTRDEGEPRLGLLRELFATASEDTKEQFATLFSALFSPLAARPRVCLCRVGSVSRVCIFDVSVTLACPECLTASQSAPNGSYGPYGHITSMGNA